MKSTLVQIPIGSLMRMTGVSNTQSRIRGFNELNQIKGENQDAIH